MKRILFRSLSLGWLLVAALVVLGALLVSLSRVAMPLANNYRAQISEQVSDLVGKPIQIGHIDVSWEGTRPLIRLTDVTLLNPETQTAILGFKQMNLTLNLWRSLRQLKLTLENLTLKGTAIELTRTRDGALLIRGFENAGEHARSFSAASLETLAGSSFHLEEAALKFNDVVLDVHYEARIQQMDIQIGRRSVALDSELDLPDSLGESIRLIVRADGPLSDVASWRAKFYLAGKDINLNGVEAFWPKAIPKASAGALNLELWGRWLPLPGLDVSGDISLLNVQLNGPDVVGGGPHFALLDEFSGRFHATGKLSKWHLDMDRVGVKTRERHWPDIAFSLAVSPWDDGSRFDADLDFADIGSLLSLIELSPSLPAGPLATLQQLQLDGELKQLRFSLRGGSQTPGYRMRAEVDQLSWLAGQKIPGVNGLQGHFSLDERGGYAELESEGLQFDAPRLFSSSLDLDHFQTRLEWEKNNEQWDIAIDQTKLVNRDATVMAAGHLLLGPGKAYPRLYLDAMLPEAEAQRIPAYIPFKIMKSAKARSWLQRAFLSGTARNAQVTYAGTLSKKAFKTHRAHLRASFDVDHVDLHYRDLWPDLKDLGGRVSFDNARLHADVKKGQVSGVKIGSALVDIKDLFQANLEVDSDAHGDFRQFLDYVRNSPLSKGKEAFLDKVRGHGNTALGLGLRIPLSHKIEQPLKVTGGLVVKDAQLGLPENEVDFSQVNGFLAFTKDTFNAVGIQAKFRGGPVTVSVKTQEDESIAVDFSGHFPAASLLPALSAQIASVTEGAARWQARLAIPSKAELAQKQPFTLKVTSDLKGIAIHLPEPLGKPERRRKNLVINYRFDPDFPGLDLQYEQLFRLRGELDAAHGQRIARAVVDLSPGDTEWPEHGIKLRGHWPTLDTSGWLKIIRQLRQYASPDSPPLDIRDITVSMDQWQLGGLVLADARIRARRSAQTWAMRLDSDRLAGNLQVPTEWKTKPAWARLDYLHLPRNEDGQPPSGKPHEGVSPMDLPSMDATVLDLRWGKSLLGEARVQMHRTATGQHIDDFTMDTEHLKTRGSGDWREIGRAQQSVLKLDLSGSDVGATLLNLGFKVGLGSGTGSLKGKLSWQGPPYLPDFPTMNGRLKAHLKDGKLSNVEPGIGRLLGLLSVDKLPRRLELNFRDVSESGFLYDSLKAEVDLFSGDLRLRRFNIDGPAAGISLSGRTSLVTHDYDLLMDVVPKIKSTLPLAAGVLAGPQTGALVFLADKVAEGLGVDLNRSIALKYKVTGDWDKPVIEALQEFYDDEPASDSLDY